MRFAVVELHVTDADEVLQFTVTVPATHWFGGRFATEVTNLTVRQVVRVAVERQRGDDQRHSCNNNSNAA